ncbi:PAS domain-containing sensor histidine kinase [Nocardioides sp. Root1257]|uniref:sensor histidine kinase n=1 Tax=unclassified Nocardioides TaxID=2615069 RepID=UPI0006F87E75|nr:MULTISPECIES: ATP-binding protein [unclassified Nocardioides]KQW43116.1 PAS domain-containing sensor histidine kinase [Nocardioides sp. Root1257]KRC41984.1 PAS domain-containing sensor histidine kinase [Nocardioides sp. Root224]
MSALEASAQQVVDSLADGVVLADAAGVVTAVNRVAVGWLGVDRVTAVGRPLAEVLALQDHEGQDWCSVNCPYDGLPTRTAVPEQAWLLPDGTEVLVVARIHRPALDQPVAAVAVSLRSGRGRARLDRERSDLVATVAHELRSPLTGVKGFVQALLNRWDKLSDDQKKLMLTTVSVDSDRLSRLIAELLDVARIDTGRLQLYPRPSDSGVLVRRVVESVAAGTSRPIELEVADALPEITVDPDKFTQVVTNLVENAVRHGSGAVRVSVSDEEAGVRVRVEDEGEGISPEMRRRVFTKFWTGGGRGGSGLGLYLVNGLVKAHGGAVVIGDADGGGARIDVVLPATAPD